MARQTPQKVSNVALQLRCFSAQPGEILAWLFLTATFESPCMGSLELTTPRRKWLNSK